MCTENIALHAEYTDNMCREKRETKNIHVSSSLIASPYMDQIDNASLITNSTLLRESNTLQYLQIYINRIYNHLCKYIFKSYLNLNFAPRLTLYMNHPL